MDSIQVIPSCASKRLSTIETLESDNESLQGRFLVEQRRVSSLISVLRVLL